MKIKNAELITALKDKFYLVETEADKISSDAGFLYDNADNRILVPSRIRWMRESCHSILHTLDEIDALFKTEAK